MRNRPLPLQLAPGACIIAPSILSSDFARLADDCDAALAAGADWLHVDVMDGRFVPNLTFGPPVISCLRRHTDAVLDVHLMIEEPIRTIEDYAAAGADIITVHVEAARHLHRTLQAIRAAGVQVGVTLNPATPVEALDYVLEEVDLVLVMSVNPGFGGQRFIPSAIRKIEAIRQRVDARGLTVTIEVDGGVKPDTIGACARAGATAFVAGSAVFGQPRYDEAIAALRQGAQVVALSAPA